MFRVKLDAGVNYFIYASGADSNDGTLANPHVAIWNSAGTTLASDQDSGRGVDALLVNFVPTTSGYYYVVVTSDNSGTGTYTVGVNVAPKHFAGDHLPVDLVSANAVDRLPIFLGGKHIVGLQSVEAVPFAPNLTTDQALSSPFDDALFLT